MSMATRVAKRFLQASNLDPFVDFIKRARKNIKSIKRNNAGPHATTATDVVQAKVDLSDLIEEIGEFEFEAILESVARSMNKDRDLNRRLAHAVGFKSKGLIEYKALRNQLNADFEFEDAGSTLLFVATSKQIVWQN